MVRSHRVILALLPLLMAGYGVAMARAPFDPAWTGVTVIWNYRKNDLLCQGEKARFVGEEVTGLVVGFDTSGHEIRKKYRLLTYRSKGGEHEIHIWMNVDLNLVREISCDHRIAHNKGYDDHKRGVVVHCNDGTRHGFNLVLQGAEKQAH